MNDSRNIMNEEINKIVIPELRKIGFSGSFPHFRRINNSEIHLLTFQFDKYGGGFIIEIAKAQNKPFKTYWGKVIEQNKLTAHDLNERIRIHPKGILKDSSTDDWFRYDKVGIFRRNVYNNVAKQVIGKLNLIEKCFIDELICE